jgi:hypothetical protein
MNTVVSTYSESKSTVVRLYAMAARLDRLGMGVLRLGLVVVLLWIGGLKFADYEGGQYRTSRGEQSAHELSLSFPRSRVPPLPKQGRRSDSRAPAMEPGKRDISGVLWTRNRDRTDRPADCLVSHYPTGFGHREFPSHFDGLYDAIVPNNHSGSLGACSRLSDTWISVSVGSRPTHYQRLHHARSGCRYNG